LQYALQPVSETPAMPSLYYHPAQAGDGRWMQFGNLLHHLFENFLIATDLVDVLADPYFDAAQMLMTNPEHHEAFRNRMLQRIQERPAADWIAEFVDNGGIAATVYQKTQEALSDPDIIANGHAIPRPDGGVELGPVARLTRTPAQPGQAPVPADALVEQWRAEPRRVPTRTRRKGLPLEGVRVVELATIIAAPLGAAFLADMGADVIKVEPVGGDPFRGMALGMGAARVNAGKRSLAVNLKSEAGRQIVLDLLKDADVLIHNYRPGVPERLGIGYEQVAALNPGIVYLQSNGYGPDGPGALRPSTHPIPGAAIGGAYYQMGERLPEALQSIDDLRKWTARLMRANELNPDPNTAVVVTTASLLGLMARERTGRGQRILVDMFGANAWANHDDFLSYPGKPDRPLPDSELCGLSATYRLYPCDGGQWLLTDRERREFHDLVVQNGFDAPSLETLIRGDDDAVQALTTLFAWETAEFWENLLAGAGIGCVRADGPFPSRFWLEDPQARELGLTAAAEHPAWGPYQRHGALVRFDGVNGPLGPAPLGGQHNEELLRMLGYDAERVAALQAEGVLWREAVE
ncbi:MAG: CaiB/BaiF CoA transferase family protein, partial [Anaerolineae bacterium]